MRARTLLAFTLTTAFTLACGGGSPAEEEEGGDGAEEGEVDLEPGHIHVDYPTAELSAEPGQFVLAPPREALDKAAADGKTGVFIYYGGEIVEVGEVESTVKGLAGKEASIPNSLIIPIEPGYAAKKGDVLLGHWESGSGLRRAIVTGGSPTAPTVRYLDRAYERDKAGDQKEDTFKEGRFHPLVAAWQVGTTLACGTGTKREHGILVHAGDEQILLSGFAGKLEARDRSDCVSLPPRQKVAAGDKVFVPALGNFTQGKVTEVDKDSGRVWVTYTWGGSEKEEAFPIVDVTKSFDAIDEGTEDDTPTPPSDAKPGAGKPGSGGGKPGGGRGTRTRPR